MYKIFYLGLSNSTLDKNTMKPLTDKIPRWGSLQELFTKNQVISQMQKSTLMIIIVIILIDFQCFPKWPPIFRDIKMLDTSV